MSAVGKRRNPSFILKMLRTNDLDFRDAQNETPSPLQIRPVVIDDGLRVNPRQDKNVVWHLFVKGLRGQDRNVITWTEFVLFVRTIVDDVTNHLGEVHLRNESRATARCSITPDGFSLALQVIHHVFQVPFELLEILAEFLERFRLVELPSALKL